MSTEENVNFHKAAARTFGIFFLLGYLSYMTGNILVQSIINSAGGLSSIYANKTLMIFGAAILMALFAFLNVGLAVIMVPILKRYNNTVTYGYLGAAITSTMMLILGAIFLLLLVPLSDEFAKSSSSNPAYFQTLSVLFSKGNSFAYQIGMAIWGLGGLMLCYLLFQSRLVPRFISIWGFLGYLIFISGTFLALFGYSVDLILDIPGGLFELFLSVWLIARGFSSSRIAFKSGN
jgi:hypothetical protein